MTSLLLRGCPSLSATQTLRHLVYRVLGFVVLLTIALPESTLAKPNQGPQKIQIPDATICPDGSRPEPGIAGEFGINFGIDGNLLPNSPNVSTPPFNTADDWTSYIDNSGNPTQPLTFHPVDLTGNADLDRFFTGVKFFEDPNTWQWTNGSSPQKDDINNGYLSFQEDDFGDLWALVGGDRRAVNGSSYIDFEFLQNSLTKNGDGTFTSLGPDGGRTVGDLLFTIKLSNGGVVAEFFAQRWSPDTLNVGEFTYYEICPGADAFVAGNIDSAVVVPWGAFGSTSYQQYAFAEGGVNLTALLGDLFDECFGISTLFVRTKSSFSDQSELKDFIAPIPINLCFDDSPPSLTCPAPVTVQCLDDVPDPSPPVATDNCDLNPLVEWIGDSPSGTCPTVITRTYRATDTCGNTSTCTQSITVNDTTPPVVVCPANVTVQCLDDVPALSPPSATDNCDDAVDVVHSGDSPSGTCPTIITRTYTATDDCGNTATCIQTITVNDTTPPEITCPADITVQCSTENVPDPSPPAATDNCDDAVDVVWVGDVPGGDCPTVVVRTYRATDDCGNTTTCTQSITIDDQTPPQITCPANVTVQCLDQVPAPNTGAVTASDDCGTPTVTHEGDVGPTGSCPATIVRTYKATDTCGNTATCTQTITINDTTPPEISCPAGITVECGGDIPAPFPPAATDNCDDFVDVVHVGDTDPQEGECPAIVVRTYQATDDCGNTATCTQTIAVECCQGICLVIIDEDTIDNGISSIQSATAGHGVTPDYLVNDDNPTEVGNPPLRWNSLFPGDIVLLPGGQVDDEGIFALPENTPWSLEDFAAGTVPQSQLDKIYDVMPVRNQDLVRLIGQTCVAVVYDSDISMNYLPIYANLQGARYGLFTFTVLAVEVPGHLPEAQSSTSLYSLWVRVEPPMQPTVKFQVPVRDHEPDAVEIPTAFWSGGNLTVVGTSDFAPGAYMTVSVDGSDGGSSLLVPPFLLEEPMALSDPTDGEYAIVYPTPVDLRGRRVTISTDEGGAYNSVIGASSGSPDLAPMQDGLPTRMTIRASVNPVRQGTTLEYTVPRAMGPSPVRIQVFSATGRLVRTLVSTTQNPGRYTERWDLTTDSGRPAASGVYLYRLTVGGRHLTNKLLVIRE